MQTKNEKITYPRRKFIRSLICNLGKVVLPAGLRLEINGRGNFPETGPVILAGNHVAAMEGVLMVVFSPWQVELFAADDIPREPIERVSRLYGFIPVRRGHMDRSALKHALEVLKQDGALGIFPEGGIWDVGSMRPQTGVAWLSYHAQAPVLPIGFSGTLGALADALKLQRPQVTMNIGRPIPPAQLPDDQPRKQALQSYAEEVMRAVYALIPESENIHTKIKNERFELKTHVQTHSGEAQAIPDELAIHHRKALAKLLHRPVILKIFRRNLHLPVGPLQDLVHVQDPARMMTAINHILDYLKSENPYLLTYRFGPKEAEEMEAGLRELGALATWATAEQLSLHITPIRRFFSVERGEEVEQKEQSSFDQWI